MSQSKHLHIGRAIYGGDFITSDPEITLPFVLRKETAEVSPEGKLLCIVEPAAERVTPRCPHFGVCGGCQYQMVNGQEQLTLKREILYNEFEKAGVAWADAVPAHSADPYGYRNRIRLRIGRVAGEPRLGYNIRTTTDFLPITTCPIAAPVLWSTAQALLALGTQDRDPEFWLNSAGEVELFCNDDLTRVQVTLLCAPRTKPAQGSLMRALNALQKLAPQVTGLHAIASDPRSGPTGRTLDTAGAPGLNYRVGDETYWISRGGFFQVNRFLISKLVDLVTANRTGNIAWDLFAGVGLFSRVLAKSFAHITAVEASAASSADLRAALARLGPQHRAIAETTLDFLRAAITQRERPDLVVLDPPRAGAGLEACELIVRLAPKDIVYVSCDPTTLARDLTVLQPHYSIVELHLIDLFPQTFHIETIAILTRTTPSLRSTL